MSLSSRVLPEPLFQGTVNLLRDLTAISSPSGDPMGLRRMAERLARELGKRGLATEIRSEPSVEAGVPLPILYARGGSSSGGHLLLIGHLDTVLAAAPPHLDGDRLVATGAIDMKGGFATLLGALDLLRLRGERPPADLLLVAVPDEEVGGEISQAAVRRWGENARALWVLEPGEPFPGIDGAETLVAGRRGMVQWRLEVQGTAAHSGLHYWEGRSALTAAARWALEAESFSERGGPTVSTGRLVAGDSSFVDHLESAHGLLGTERQLNVVPDRAVAEGELRFLRSSDGSRILQRLQSLTEDVGITTRTNVSFTSGLEIPPVDPEGPHATLTRRAVELAAARGWRLEIETDRGGISFPNFLTDPGRIPVLDGLGPIGGGMHTREEFVDLGSLRRRIVLLADLLAAEAERV
ncbi:MAG: glutamate carboxypeptidase [Acidobacteriota bacterium]|jgi:glutamate carboxypeptidase|nr:glutamate carboxypeptidase [Acidobacteriota bacterium]